MFSRCSSHLFCGDWIVGRKGSRETREQLSLGSERQLCLDQ